MTEGALLGLYEFQQYKARGSRDNGEQDTESDGGCSIQTITILGRGREPALRSAVERGKVLAEATNFARDLGNEPPNVLTPTEFGARAQRMAEEVGLECEVYGPDWMREQGMGALLGVAQGSEEPPCLIILRYRPASEAAGPHLGLVGKGVTFDTGGISIKPSADMDKMKYDMAGGAAAIGAMRAITQLKPAIPVTALVPAVENMPGGRAQRPGDIVKTLSGKTVEVLNTDAEGRLILADTMTYAQKLGCTHLVDAATLTGAIVVALGHVNTGAFANDEALLERVLAAARAEGEKTWPMPLDDEYKAELESAFADLPNIGSRWGGAVTAAMFLKTFADPLPWVHLDVAGTAWLDEEKPFLAAGPTGAPLRTFVRVAVDWK
jgi:leucyl aminopeptidase